MEPIVICAALKILLVRHGDVEGIKPERFRGRQPLARTALGRAQAAAVTHRIAGTWQPSTNTSPMDRCVQTGAAIASASGTTAAIYEDLNDIDYGAWQLVTFDQAHRVDPALFAAWFATPQYMRFAHGESLHDAADASSAPAIRTTPSCWSTASFCCNCSTCRYRPTGGSRRNRAASMKPKSPATRLAFSVSMRPSTSIRRRTP